MSDDKKIVEDEITEMYKAMFGEDFAFEELEVTDDDADMWRKNGRRRFKRVSEYGFFDLNEKKYETDINGDIIKRFQSAKDLPNDFFRKPKFSALLPPFSDRVAGILKRPVKPILLKRSSTQRMIEIHPKEMGKSKDVLENALYKTDVILYNRPESRPTYYVAMRSKGKTVLATIDIDSSKEYFEIVDWRHVSDEEIDAMLNKTPSNGHIYWVKI